MNNHISFSRVSWLCTSCFSKAGIRDNVDLFILSNSTIPTSGSRRSSYCFSFGENCRTDDIFYRHRSNNVARKSGNIREWVTAFGGGYECMIIFDADSLMTPESIGRLTAAMERDLTIGLIQTLPVIVNAATPFAKLQQFAGRLYGPLIAAGIAWWHGSESNYWGHNAIIRVRAFAETAGLPELSGRRPFGGHVLSHDFIEAALMRRGGWAVCMAPSVGGSYEECPSTPIDYAARDRRWCQGNLQHLGLLTTRGLHWVSRLHLLVGIGSYLTAPMWLVFLAFGILISLQAQFIRPEYFPSGFSLFPKWPAQDPIRAIWVFSATMGLLLAPKILALILLWTDSSLRRKFGGGFRTFAGMLLEALLSGLMAPLMMIFQSAAVAEILLGRDAGWQVQRRDAGGRIRRNDLLRTCAVPTIIGALMAVSAYMVSASLLLWMTPVVVGLLFCIPVTSLVSSPKFGDFLKRHGMLATPEHIAPAPIVCRANAAAAAFDSHQVDAFVRLCSDQQLQEQHLINLPAPSSRQRGQIDVDLVVARAKLADAETLDDALLFLSPREKFALLKSTSGVQELIQKFIVASAGQVGAGEGMRAAAYSDAK